MPNLLQLLRNKVDPEKVKKVSSAKGGEWHSPCPLCGGVDRFCAFPEQAGGEICQKYGLRGTWSCARGCGKGGDLISWYTEIEGLSFKEACLELNIALDSKEGVKRGYRPLRQFYKPSSSFSPRYYLPPSEQWQNAATKLALDANKRIYEFPVVMKYLAKRGLPQGSIDKYRLGYIEGDGKRPEAIYRARSAYGLPEKSGNDGKPVRAFRIPRGITIPVWTSDLRVLRVRIRRRDIDRDKSNLKDPKYLLVPQPGQPYSAPLMLFPENIPLELATWVITEAELDAMAIHFACKGKIGAMSILTAKGKPDMTAHNILSRSARILVALDADDDKADGANPGAEGWLWWKQTYSQAKLWPTPVGKDPGEAYAMGVDLAEWIFAGSPLHKSSASAGSSQVSDIPQDSGKMSASQKSVEERKEEQEIETLPLQTSAETFEDIQLPPTVTHRDLLRSQMKYPLGDPECLLPCPKTKSPFSWRYHRDCKRFKCKGDPQCLLGILRSQIFLEALNAEKNLLGKSLLV